MRVYKASIFIVVHVGIVDFLLAAFKRFLNTLDLYCKTALFSWNSLVKVSVISSLFVVGGISGETFSCSQRQNKYGQNLRVKITVTTF